MNYTYLHYQIGLDHLCGVGPKTAKHLIKELGSAESLFQNTFPSLVKKTRFSRTFFENMRREEALQLAEKVVAYNKENKIQSIFYQDERYPERLRHCEDGPLNLFMLGDIDLNDGHFVSIVGTRDASPYGRFFCEKLVRSFIDQNIIVVSGLANGIDSWTHHYCVQYNVPTIAVLGHGLDRIYPANNKNLAKAILSNGALITEFIQGTNPDRENFPKRNRIVAGMCDATIVVESREKGGSLITANLANDYNRDVFAVPGDVDRETSAGCNALIANDQAHLLSEPAALMSQMGWVAKKPANRQRKVIPNLSSIQKKIVALLEKSDEMHLDNIALSMKQSVSTINVEMLHLELEGAVISCTGNRYKLP